MLSQLFMDGLVCAFESQKQMYLQHFGRGKNTWFNHPWYLRSSKMTSIEYKNMQEQTKTHNKV